MTGMDLLRAVGTAEDAYIEELYGYMEQHRGRKRPRVMVLAALIAVILLAVSVGAAGIVRWEEDSWFDRFFAQPSQKDYPEAVTDHQRELLDVGLVEVGQSVTQEGYTVTLASALCDGNRLLAKIVVEAPDDILLEEGRYDILLEYRPLYPDGTKIPFGAMTGSCSQLDDPDPSDGTLQFLLDVRSQPKPDAGSAMLMGAKWEIRISKLQHSYYASEEYRVDTLAEGDWRFEILFDESSLLKREQELLDKPFRLRATRYWDEHGFPVDIRVTSLRLRALSATLCYDKPLTGFWHGIMVGDIYVVLKDGTMILADWDMGHSKGDHWQDTLVFPVPVPWEDVDHVLLPDGKRIAVG